VTAPGRYDYADDLTVTLYMPFPTYTGRWTTRSVADILDRDGHAPCFACETATSPTPHGELLLPSTLYGQIVIQQLKIDQSISHATNLHVSDLWIVAFGASSST
jgi:hypothetical protein